MTLTTTNLSQVTDPKQALPLARIIWAAMVAGVLFIGIILTAVGDYSGQAVAENADATVALADSPAPMLWFYLAGGITIVLLPAGLFMRGQIFKRGWEDGHVTPAAFLNGHVVAWAFFEGAAMVGLIFTFVAEVYVPHIVAPAVAWGVLLFTFPRRGLMRDADGAADSALDPR